MQQLGKLQSTVVAFLLLTQQPQIRFSAFPQKSYFDVAEIYQYPWLEESGQRLKNVEWTYLVPAYKYYKESYTAFFLTP